MRRAEKRVIIDGIEYASVKEASEKLGCSEVTVYRRIKRTIGKLKVAPRKLIQFGKNRWNARCEWLDKAKPNNVIITIPTTYELDEYTKNDLKSLLGKEVKKSLIVYGDEFSDKTEIQMYLVLDIENYTDVVDYVTQLYHQIESRLNHQIQ